MIEIEATPTDIQVPVTATGIPIRNLWYMLLYAWKDLRTNDRWSVDVEISPTLDALLAAILSKLMAQQLRIGLGRGYTDNESLIHGIRGRVDFAQSLTRLAFQQGKAFCRFQTYDPNVPKNQIVRSTLARLAQVGDFGVNRSHADELRHALRRLVRDLDVVDFVELKPELIRRQQLQRHDADYSLMLAICHLVSRRQIPTEAPGTQRLPGLDRDTMILWRVFERFVANFYAVRLTGWTVKAQTTLHWHETKSSVYLPVMTPDVVLQNHNSWRLIVLDTKFTEGVLTTGRWDNLTFDRGHLYQMYAYLRSQEHLSEHHACTAGILLYPTVKHGIPDSIEVQGHPIRWETIDLRLPWMDIEHTLLKIVDPTL